MNAKQTAAGIRRVRDRLDQIEQKKTKWDEEEAELERILADQRAMFQNYKKASLDQLRSEKADLYQDLSALRCWVKPGEKLEDTRPEGAGIVTVHNVQIHIHTAQDADPIFSISYTSPSSPAYTTIMNVQNKDLKKLFKKVTP